jgi:hypothetical protein
LLRCFQLKWQRASSTATSDVPNDRCIAHAFPVDPGTRVTIKGTNLLGSYGGTEITEVTLAGVKATILEANDTHVIVSANNGTFPAQLLQA